MVVNAKSWKKVRQPEGFISVDPIPSEQELRDFYAEQYYQQTASASYQAEYSEQELAYKRLQAQVFLLAAGPAAASEGSLLDIGCGEGFVLAESRRHGWQSTGIDFSAYAINRFHPDLRDNVEVGDAFAILERFVGDGRRFGACVLQNVLEHMVDPRRMLARLKDLLAPGGKVLVMLPNDYSSLQMMALESGLIDHEYWFVPPQHLHYFDIEAASLLARECGYEVADTFADFPIEAYLLHPGSNYVRDRDAGPAAHKARMSMSLLCAQKGLEAYLDLCRSYARCGIGRAFTLILTRCEQA